MHMTEIYTWANIHFSLFTIFFFELFIWNNLRWSLNVIKTNVPLYQFTFCSCHCLSFFCCCGCWTILFFSLSNCGWISLFFYLLSFQNIKMHCTNVISDHRVVWFMLSKHNIDPRSSCSHRFQNVIFSFKVELFLFSIGFDVP